ncbi:MAG: topoisomerase DNA-binding C4 zinc finger domain-containing protein [Pseudomonadota bacterium]|nr:topoisomerase DNA-binding C4 zinc finger domain-containing protein [Pseudomonadota bacterium]MDP1906311.1 topoisomerase DNA-binding C4 zinc finger domain-containing protein [Pseudomonadota bacterium]MDP2351786.1 topoisomerase DNA-binding C4 zinc finger domain-containing protein [Pseudomonadota bacterium]
MPAIVPTCPRCGSAMVKRIAKQGANAGSTFWGCTDFPKCRGVRVID